MARFLAIAAVLATAVSAADEFCCRCQTFEDHKAFCTHLMGGRDRIAASELLSNGCVGPTKWPELDKKLVPKAPLCLSKCDYLKKVAFATEGVLTMEACEAASPKFHGQGCSLCLNPNKKMCHADSDSFCDEFSAHAKFSPKTKRTIMFKAMTNPGCEGTCRDKCLVAQAALSDVATKEEAITKCKAVFSGGR